MQNYLKSSDIIDWEHKEVSVKAKELAKGLSSHTDIAKVCFEWVRDTIKHSNDFALNPVTCSASEVLAAGTGYCYAKSHLLAALLRANSIPTGLCYQRLSRDDNGAPFCLHGLNAIFLPEIGWYRVDPRGNKENVNAQFTPPIECLAFSTQIDEEIDLPEIWAEPLPMVVNVLKKHETYSDVWQNLPDIETWLTTRD
ncbi:transglutaminase-like enzyme, putative cysteine protease [Desulfocapsa sulfexigens DSM 10523]|uniref:Transglutaminase-like enzyme, putative cysteine protease n=1 Tax=Desulfocapsa sulfexigens (strain DSM 10523 / SB164P1) TaxID=1167006 RepID=M1PNM9_DESSD|nr:transglutaminase family protein [Desulfocapsa sulfexigens]AGF78011.1 transglutaminase-like enzyme, putative cysteine protease [Desulfocapsa sulfexigens DSM 10523]